MNTCRFHLQTHCTHTYTMLPRNVTSSHSQCHNVWSKSRTQMQEWQQSFLDDECLIKMMNKTSKNHQDHTENTGSKSRTKQLQEPGKQWDLTGSSRRNQQWTSVMWKWNLTLLIYFKKIQEAEGIRLYLIYWNCVSCVIGQYVFFYVLHTPYRWCCVLCQPSINLKKKKWGFLYFNIYLYNNLIRHC